MARITKGMPKRIKIFHLKDVVFELANKEMVIKSASGASLVDLVLLDAGTASEK